MDSKAIRRHNLLGLISEFHTVAALSRASDVVATYLRQIKTGHREMGDDVARKLEAALNKPAGWMDSPQFLAVEGTMDQTEALQILQSLSAADREAWLKHGRLLVGNGDERGAHNPFGAVPKPGKPPGTQ